MKTQRLYALGALTATAALVLSSAGAAFAQATTTYGYHNYNNNNYNNDNHSNTNRNNYNNNNYNNNNYNRGSNYNYGYSYGAQQLYTGRAYNVHSTYFLLLSPNGYTYYVYYRQGARLWNTRGTNLYWGSVRNGDYVRINGIYYGGVIYATVVRDISR